MATDKLVGFCQISVLRLVSVWSMLVFTNWHLSNLGMPEKWCTVIWWLSALVCVCRWSVNWPSYSQFNIFYWILWFRLFSPHHRNCRALVNLWLILAGFLRGLEKYGIWFKYFPGLEKYGKKKAEYGKIFVFPDLSPYLVFYNKLRILWNNEVCSWQLFSDSFRDCQTHLNEYKVHFFIMQNAGYKHFGFLLTVFS